jgi:peptide/nickel transport system substrate-binding protein
MHDEHPTTSDGRSRWWLPSHLSVSRRQLILGGSAAAMSLALGACGGDDDDAARTTDGAGDPADGTQPQTSAGSQRGGTLRVGVLGSPNDVCDGQHVVGKADQARMLGGWESILNFDEDFNLVTTDSLAEEVETKAADLYVVRLKEGLVFSNGAPVTGEDLLYSFNRLIDPELAVFGGSALRPVLEASGITKVDDRTVQLQLLQPVANFKEYLAAYTCCVVPAGYERFSGDPTTQIGTGPYQLAEFEVGVQSVHVRNDNYWQTGKQFFDEVRVINFADGDALVNALIADQIDCAVDIPSTAVNVLESTDGYKVLNSEGGAFLSITMAVDQEPFTDVRVRQAMRLIVDRQAMVDQVVGGFGRIANDLYSPLDPVYIGDELPQRDQDIEAAKALLAEAGVADLEIDLYAPNDTVGLPELAQAFSAMAAEAGITVNPVILDGGTYWGDQYLKWTFATGFWGTRNFLPQVAAGSLHTAPYNDDHWPPADSTFADDYAAALAEVDDAKRKVITDKMQTELYEAGGQIIPFFQNQLDGYHQRVGGLVARPNTVSLDHFGRGYKNLYFNS